MHPSKILPLVSAAALLFVTTVNFDVRAGANRQDEPPLEPEIIYPLQRGLSPSLSSLVSEAQEEVSFETIPPRPLPKAENALQAEPFSIDPALQTISAEANMPSTGFNFEGIPKRNGVIPPDTNGDVGPNHYVQWVNLSLQVWQLDRDQSTATSVYGPVDGNILFASLGGPCANSNHGDPIVLYDHLADRWFLSQFALPNFPSGPYYQCIAVSQSGDPTGGYYLYEYEYSTSKMNDYPKFGVWPDGYYMTVNQFNYGSSWAGGGVAVFERDMMLQGLTARMVKFDLYSANPNFGGMLPSDLDGTPPPPGTPNYFAEVDDGTWIAPVDALRIWEFHVNWSNPTSSTFGNNRQPNQIIPVDNFIPFVGSSGARKVPQPGNYDVLDSLADRLMYRLQYRNFGTHASLVTNHTVDAGDIRAAVRWYELRNSGGGWSIQQQGTYAGDGANSIHRWMGSVAMDRTGNIAVGYSRSSNSLYPDIAYNGRLIDDPPNTLPQGEAVLRAGNGSQTHSSGRWGDYSMMSVDPTDDCTFWHTNEYYSSTSSSNWRTRIGSFLFPSCISDYDGALQGNVTSGGDPLEDALVEAGAYSTLIGPDGFYSFPQLPVGAYTVTASAYGYQAASFTGVEVLYNNTTVQDFSLVQLPLANVHGLVSDGSGQGWPLYARIDISADSFSQAIFTDPLTGAYQIDLPQGTAHTFEVNALVPGYLPQTVPVFPDTPDTVQDFSLSVDATSCNAPGYLLAGSCEPQASGMLIGHVYDANTATALNGATVASDDQPGDSTLSFGTPDDAAEDDGLYVLFSSLTGLRSFTASKSGYGISSDNVNITDGGIASLNFNLPAGRLQANPTHVLRHLAAGEVVTVTVVLSNTGSMEADFTITEVDAPAPLSVPTGPFARATRHTSPKRLGDLDAHAVYEYVPPPADLLPGGQVLRSWPSALVHPWGIGYERRTGSLWIGDVAIAGGDDRLHRFDTDGIGASESIDTSAYGASYAASMAFNPFTGKLWIVSVGADSCIFEVDPLSQAMTGDKICPAFDHSQRGLAFNPLDHSYYSGAWTNGIIYHFAQSGMILDSANLDLNISGLAFNPATRHLFVLSNANTGFDVYVLDAEAGYAVLGGFDIPGLGDFEQAGMSIDCAGNLWVVNQISGMVYEVESGEAPACTYADVPWLQVTPAGGTLPQGGAQVIQIRLDTNAALSGHNQAHLVITTTAPYGDLIIPVNMNFGTIFHLPLMFDQ